MPDPTPDPPASLDLKNTIQSDNAAQFRFNNPRWSRYFTAPFFSDGLIEQTHDSDLGFRHGRGDFKRFCG